MTAQVMADNRATFAADDKSRATAAEATAAIGTYESYFGTYAVDEDTATVIHTVEGALFPNWVGTEQRRFAELSGRRLVLRTPPLPYGGSDIIARIIWERFDRTHEVT
jgi:hypothetical protein